MQFLNIIKEILAPNKHNINFGSLNMTVQRMPNILQYVLQYALAVSYRIAIRLQPQYPPLEMVLVFHNEQDQESSHDILHNPQAWMSYWARDLIWINLFT